MIMSIFIDLFSHYRINEGRKEWVALIQAKQNLDTDKDIYICDLHFHQRDLYKNGKNLRLTSDAVPQLRLFISDHSFFAFQILISLLYFQFTRQFECNGEQC